MAGTQVASLFVHLALNNQMTSALRSARGDFDGFHGRVRSGMQTLYTEAVRLSGAVAAVFGAGRVIGAMAEFDRNLKNIQAVSKRTGDEMKALGDEILRISEGSVYGAEDASKTFYQIASAVEDASAQMEIFKASMNLAASGQADLEKTTDFMIAVMQSFNMESSKASYVGDVLAQTVRYGRSEMNAFAAAMAPTANLVASIGANFEEWGAGVSYMDKLGATAAMAATRYQRMIISLLNPNTTMEGILEQMGVGSGTELVAKYGGSIAEAYRAIYEVIGGDQNMLMQAVGRQEAFNGALALIEDGFKEYMDLFTSDIAGQTTEMLGVQMEALTAKFDRLKSQLEAVAVRLGQSVAPALGTVVGFVSKLIDGLNRVNPAILPFAGGLTILVTSLLPMLPLLSAVGGAFMSLFMPVLLVGGAVTGILYAIATNFMGLRNVFSGLVADIKLPLSIFAEYLRVGFLNFFAEGRGSIRERLDFFFKNSLPGILKSGGDLIRITARSVLDALGELVNIAAILLPRILTGGGNLFLSLLSALAGGIDFSGIVETIGGWLSSDGAQLFLARVKTFLDVARNWLETEGKRIFEEALASALTIVSNIETWWGENVAPLQDQVTVWLVGAYNWLVGGEAAKLIGGGLKTAFGIVDTGLTWLEDIVPKVRDWIAGGVDWILNTGAMLIQDSLKIAFTGEGGAGLPSGSFGIDQLNEHLNTLPTQRGLFDRIGDLLIGNIATLGGRIVESLRTLFNERIELPDWLQTVVNIFLGPLSDAFSKLSDINWDNIALAGVAIAGFFGGFKILRSLVGFDLLVNFIDKLDDLIENLKQGDFSGALYSLAGALIAFGGALVVFNAGGAGSALLSGLLGTTAAGAAGGVAGKAVGGAGGGFLAGFFQRFGAGLRTVFDATIGASVGVITKTFGLALSAVFANPIAFGIAAISIIAGSVIISALSSVPQPKMPTASEMLAPGGLNNLAAWERGPYRMLSDRQAWEAMNAGAGAAPGGGTMGNVTGSVLDALMGVPGATMPAPATLNVEAQQVRIGENTTTTAGGEIATSFASTLTVDQRAQMNDLFRELGLTMFGRMAQPGQVLGNVLFNFDDKTEILLTRFIDTVLGRQAVNAASGGGANWVPGVTPMGRRAAGGPVKGYQVGEGNKPELFSTSNGLFLIPGDRGNVIPFGGSRGGGAPMSINGPINVYGVQDPESLLDALQQAAGRRNMNIYARNR